MNKMWSMKPSDSPHDGFLKIFEIEGGMKELKSTMGSYFDELLSSYQFREDSEMLPEKIADTEIIP